MIGEGSQLVSNGFSSQNYDEPSAQLAVIPTSGCELHSAREVALAL